MLHGICHFHYNFFIYLYNKIITWDKVLKLVGGGSVINGATQFGLYIVTFNLLLI